MIAAVCVGGGWCGGEHGEHQSASPTTRWCHLKVAPFTHALAMKFARDVLLLPPPPLLLLLLVLLLLLLLLPLPPPLVLVGWLVLVVDGGRCEQCSGVKTSKRSTTSNWPTHRTSTTSGEWGSGIAFGDDGGWWRT